MSQRRATCIILCEDRRQSNFVRHCLKKKGWNNREIKEKICPPALGSAEQFVRDQFPNELQDFRTRSAKAKTILITVVDGDVKGFGDRCEDLAVPFRNDDEAVAILIPTRNIDTWLYYLKGNRVNEEDDYKNRNEDKDCKQTAKKLLESCSSSGLISDIPPSSLIKACDEYNMRIRLIK